MAPEDIEDNPLLCVALRKLIERGVLEEDSIEELAEERDIDEAADQLEDELKEELMKEANVSRDELIRSLIEADGSDDWLQTLFGVLLRTSEMTRRKRAELLFNELRQNVDNYEQEYDVLKENSAYLRGEKIRELAHEMDLIDPFRDKNLRPASYELTVGDMYAKEGKLHEIDDEPKENITIPPYGTVVIKTTEVINLPRNLTGTLNIKVSKAHQGLLWVGGPPIDPGYIGYLYCPIYNLSNTEVSLDRNEAFGTIDFSPTTDLGDGGEPELYYGEDGVIDQAEHDVVFEDYEGTSLEPMSLKLDDYRDQIRDVENEVSRMRRTLFTSIGATYTALAVLVAVLSFSLSNSGENQTGLSLPEPIPLVLAVLFGFLILVPVVLVLERPARGIERRVLVVTKSVSNLFTKSVRTLCRKTRAGTKGIGVLIRGMAKEVGRRPKERLFSDSDADTEDE